MPVDIEALEARYQNEDFWRRSMQEGDEEVVQNGKRVGVILLLRGLDNNSLQARVIHAFGVDDA
jgi:hypothetical protein